MCQWTVKGSVKFSYVYTDTTSATSILNNQITESTCLCSVTVAGSYDLHLAKFVRKKLYDNVQQTLSPRLIQKCFI
jgi:hypothetical protein